MNRGMTPDTVVEHLDVLKYNLLCLIAGFKFVVMQASVARKKRSVFRDYMCTWLTALAVLRYAPDYGDFGQVMVMFLEWPKASG